MRRLQSLPMLARILLAALGLMLSAGTMGHQGEHAGVRHNAQFLARAIEQQADPATDAGLTSFAVHGSAQDYAAAAPPCPGGAGGSCCCNGFAGVVSTPTQLIVPQQPVLTAPQPSLHRPKLACGGNSIPMALLVAATHGARAPPAFP